MTKISNDCSLCQDSLADLLLDPGAVSPAVSSHVSTCRTCAAELRELQATMGVMDAWTAPEPSPYFDTRLYARLREAQHAAPEGFWERLGSSIRFSTGRSFRPALAGALGVAMLLGGGTAATLLVHHLGTTPSSPTVNDLRIYDNNATAVQQMDLLDAPGDDAPQS